MTSSSPVRQPISEQIDNIFHQARQGSVAAVIQLLNEQLADEGVRTRAVLEDNILQVLCEALTPGQLEQSTLVPRIKGMLEGMAPRGIRRVNLNSRIVREQQLLWLEEIRRDPQGQLLWSELITLKRINPIKRAQEDRRWQQQLAARQPSQKSAKASVKPFMRGVIGGASAVVLIGIIGWATQAWLRDGGLTSGADEGSTTAATTTADPATSTNPDTAAEPTADPAPAPDPFAQAVELATQAAQDGLTAATPTDWLDLATRWQRAADLMAAVEADDSRYPLAQTKVGEYQTNSDMALQRAEMLRSQ